MKVTDVVVGMLINIGKEGLIVISLFLLAIFFVPFLFFILGVKNGK